MVLAVKVIQDSHRKTLNHRPAAYSSMDKLTSYFINIQTNDETTINYSHNVQRYVYISGVIIIAFIVNTLTARLLEILKNFIQRRLVQHNDGLDGVATVLGFIFESINLVFTALLSWGVYGVGCKLFQDK